MLKCVNNTCLCTGVCGRMLRRVGQTNHLFPLPTQCPLSKFPLALLLLKAASLTTHPGRRHATPNATWWHSHKEALHMTTRSGDTHWNGSMRRNSGSGSQLRSWKRQFNWLWVKLSVQILKLGGSGMSFSACMSSWAGRSITKRRNNGTEWSYQRRPAVDAAWQ